MARHAGSAISHVMLFQRDLKDGNAVTGNDENVGGAINLNDSQK
jgi:hypothetical protein